MAVGEISGGALREYVPPSWWERWRELKARYHDWRDERRIQRKEKRAEKRRQRIERNLRGRLRKELRRTAKRMQVALTRLGMAYKRRRDNRQTISKVQFAEAASTPAAHYLRVDTLRMPWKISTMMLQDSETIEHLGLAVGAPVKTFTKPDKGFWYVIERGQGLASIPHFVEYVDALRQMPKTADRTDVPLGIGANKKFYHVDLTDCPHLLVAGQTGFGKSVFLHNVICSLMQRAKPQHVRLVMADLKGGAELGIYRGVPHLAELGSDESEIRIEPRIYAKRQEVPAVLRRLSYELDRRLQMFQKERVRNLSKWNFHHRGARRLPRIICIIDEIANVMLDRSLRREAEDLMADIAARGRAPGIHLVVATQRPSTDVITGLIKANFPSRIAFSTASMADSRVILDISDAARLGPPGRAIYRAEQRKWTFQCPFISGDLALDVVERIIEGREALTEHAHHNVGRMTMIKWAIQDNGGDFGIDDVYAKFRGQNVTHSDVREIAADLVGETVEVDGKFYRMQKARGPYPRRFVEVEGE